MSCLDDDFDHVYRRHAASVYRRAHALLHSEADAQDVVHDVFLSLFERPEQYAGRSSLTTFLYRATTNACLTRIRKAKNRDRLLRTRVSPSGPEQGQPAPQVDALRLRQALSRMPDALARVAVYAWLDELSHAEIAELVGCSRRQVGNLLQRVEVWVHRQEEPSCC